MIFAPLGQQPRMENLEDVSVDQLIETMGTWTTAGATGFAIDVPAPSQSALFEAMDWLMRDVRPLLN